ncbi:MAG: hypothetical protein FWE61_01660 [Micrococcales bacterium]|nr:hypothetical protein [Micrococcales bacterium]
MAKNPLLDDAIAVFTELGWADATYADVTTLPVGDAAQRKAALAGLRSGDWAEEKRPSTCLSRQVCRACGSRPAGVDPTGVRPRRGDPRS